MEEPIAPHGPNQAPSGPSSSGQGDGANNDPNAKKKANPNATSRKRTKTGCLTCRRRRIKCDEGRPICNNCIKSKRVCEGYNQRVIFKDPIGAHPLSGPFGPMGYIHGTALPFSQLASQQARSSGQGPLPNIAPKPPAFDYHHLHHPQYHPQHHHHLQYGGHFSSGISGSVSQAHFNFGTNPYHLGTSYAPQSNPLTPSDAASGHGDFGQSFHSRPPPLAAHTEYHTPSDIEPGWKYTTFEAPRGHPMLPIPQQASQLAVQSQEASYNSSDEDASVDESEDEGHNMQNLMAPVIGFYGQATRDVSLRTFSSFAQKNMLGEYMSSPYMSELKDSAKRKLFEHFTRVTGPSMSLYERHLFDTAEKVGAEPGSETARSIWSYTFPLVSLHHPGLLHAMLAMASLQISKLQNAPPTAAHKHYHIALRRVAKNLKTQHRRLQPATLAATLLLAYFEVWNSEHTKWCSHLCGARTLFAQIPFRDMCRRCLPLRSLKGRQRITEKMGFSGFGDTISRDPNTLDFDLLTTIIGYSVTAGDYGLREDQLFSSTHSSTTEKDLENFENLRDLYWWYCKMDVYQSMLGGTKLFMDYEHWTQCPPRAPMSRLDGIYGTYDHLMLLLARLASFASNDLPRKRRVTRARGPPPGGASPPSFPGMLPTKGNVRLPMGFSPPRNMAPQSDPGEQVDPERGLQAALEEWESIRLAFEVFESRLSAEFRPLSSEYADRRDFPFGPALQYRTYSIAGIWMNYYTGLINLHRSHPSMPPTAMQSVGLSAPKTAGYANQIGRIAVGLSDDCTRVTELSTVTAAAFIESGLCLFVAAVQYQDYDQRKWVVRRMHDITRLTGWQSARQIAEGCESTWVRAAQAGRGPAYERATHLDDTEKSVWDNTRRIDRRRIQEVDSRGGNERRIVLARSERAHYALGLLGVEDDLEYLDLKDETFNMGPKAHA